MTDDSKSPAVAREDALQPIDSGGSSPQYLGGGMGPPPDGERGSASL